MQGKGCRGMELEVEQKGLKGAARFIQLGLQPAGVNWGEGKGWTAGQTKPLLLHFCPSGQTPTLYTRALPSYARARSYPSLLDQHPRNPSMLRRVVLSVRYFSSSLINGTVASLAGLASSRRIRRNGFRRAPATLDRGRIVFGWLDSSLNGAACLNWKTRLFFFFKRFHSALCQLVSGGLSLAGRRYVVCDRLGSLSFIIDRNEVKPVVRKGCVGYSSVSF